MLISSSTSSSSGRPRRDLFSSTSDDSDLLLCGEDAGSLSNDDSPVPPILLFPSGVKYSAGSDDDGEEDDEEELAAMWTAAETDYSPGMGYRSRFDTRSGHLDAVVRRQSVAWILKVREFYQFRPLTAYLAVNYMDRFLSRHAFPQQPGGWPVQLLAVACLSLAAKMEETLVPSFLDLQVEEARFVFEPRTILRMELLVLDALNWRLRAVTPFAFLGFFACKADPSRSRPRYLVSRAAHIILATLEEIEFLGQCPSAMAAAAVTCAAGEAPAMSSITPESAASWCAGLTREGVVNCHQLMQELIVDGDRRRRRQREAPLQQRAKASSGSMGSDVYSPSMSSSSSFSSSSKRRKLSSTRWVEDSKELKGP